MGDVDLDARTITMATQLVEYEGGVHESEPKSDAGSRSVALDAESVTAFRWHRTRQLMAQLDANDAWIDTGRVLTRVDGSWVAPGWLSDHFERLVRRRDYHRSGYTTCGTGRDPGPRSRRGHEGDSEYVGTICRSRSRQTPTPASCRRQPAQQQKRQPNSYLGRPPEGWRAHFGLTRAQSTLPITRTRRPHRVRNAWSLPLSS